MADELSYAEHPAPDDLASIVRCVWHLSGPSFAGSPDAIQPIVPDGCPEVILNLDEPFVQMDAPGHWVRQPRAFLVGQMTGPAWVGPSGSTRIVGIRLTPWGASHLFGIPVAELRDEFVPLDQVAQAGLLPGGAGFEQLTDQLNDLPARAWAPRVFDHLRRELLPEMVTPGLGARVVTLIGEHRGRITVKGMARALHVGERQLERTMQREVGLAPIVFARIMRIQTALGEMMESPERTLSQVALGAGFYDQPHFVREFRRLVGCTPSQFQTGDFGMTRHFVADPGDFEEE